MAEYIDRYPYAMLFLVAFIAFLLFFLSSLYMAGRQKRRWERFLNAYFEGSVYHRRGAYVFDYDRQLMYLFIDHGRGRLVLYKCGEAVQSSQP